MINRCNMLSGCVKPTYLVIFKGDDTNFPGNQEIEIVIDTEMDLTGLKAHFRFMDFTQDFNEIPENKKLNIVIPHDKTSAFPIGASDATLFLEDQSGKIRTVSNRIHVVVTNSVHEAYENEDAQSVTVTVKGTFTWDMIEDKPTIPEPSDTDPLMDGEASAGTFDEFSRGDHVHPSDESKLDGAATYPAWEKNHIYLERTVVSYNGRLWFTQHGVVPILGIQTPPPDEDPDHWVEVYIKDLKQDALTSEQIGYINAVPSKAPLASPALTGTPTAPTAESGTNTTQIATTEFVQGEVSGKADKAVPSADGNLASLTATGNLADSGVKPSDFATKADLPYRQVEPGKWEYEPSVQLTNFEVTSSPVYNSADADPWSVTYYSEETGNETLQAPGGADALSLDFGTFTATRASLPDQLCDRAGNRVVVSGDTTLTLPAAVPGYLRDFLVRLEISGSTVPTITFQGQGSEAPNGADEIIYETDGDEFPVPDETGTWDYAFTENCVAHKFAVSLKKVNTVAAPTQGGE